MVPVWIEKFRTGLLGRLRLMPFWVVWDRSLGSIIVDCDVQMFLCGIVASTDSRFQAACGACCSDAADGFPRRGLAAPKVGQTIVCDFQQTNEITVYYHHLKQ